MNDEELRELQRKLSALVLEANLTGNPEKAVKFIREMMKGVHVQFLRVLEDLVKPLVEERGDEQVKMELEKLLKTVREISASNE